MLEMAHLLPEPNSPFETIIYHRRISLYHEKMEKKLVKIHCKQLTSEKRDKSIYELRIFDRWCRERHKWCENTVGYNCIKCGIPKLPENTNIILPDEIISKILSYIPNALHTSISLSKSIRNYSMKNLILKSRKIKDSATFYHNAIESTILNIQYISNRSIRVYYRNRCSFILETKTMPKFRRIYSDYDYSDLEFVSKKSMNVLVRNTITTKLWNVNITYDIEEAIQTIVDEEVYKYRRKLPGNLFLLYSVMDTSKLLTEEYVLEYYNTNKI